MQWTTIALLLSLAFLVNLPLGAWRESRRKFSPAWFVGIHASIPLLLAVRMELDVTHWVIPLEIALVLAGQIVGSRLRLVRGISPPTAEARVRTDA